MATKFDAMRSTSTTGLQGVVRGSLGTHRDVLGSKNGWPEMESKGGGGSTGAVRRVRARAAARVDGEDDDSMAP